MKGDRSSAILGRAGEMTYNWLIQEGKPEAGIIFQTTPNSG